MMCTAFGMDSRLSSERVVMLLYKKYYATDGNTAIELENGLLFH